jgi:hypothetical protein
MWSLQGNTTIQSLILLLGKIRNYNLANTVSVVLAHASLRAGIYDR